ncbi:MAG: hypothetical protein KY467_04605 [Gemmatimonadetes bacterium]|nr:hypothetical protein [Gemmatimonadota bacterium]
MRTSRLFFFSIALAAAAAPAAAQNDSDRWVENCRRNNNYGGSDREVHCEVRETRLPARGSLRVDAGQNGGVSVRAWDGRDVLVRAKVQTNARTEAEAREIARGIRVSTDGTIRSTGPETSGRNRGWAVSYEILVPARTDLNVETHNGPISVERLHGDIRLRAVNGPISLVELAGDVQARAQNGPITVTLAGRRWNGEGLDAETVNGPVTLRMPRGYAAHLESATVHGPISAPNGIRPERDERRRWSPGGRISTDLNGGGPTIRVVTTNGPVRIREM